MQQCKNSKQRELTEEESVSVILLYKEGKTYRKIGSKLGHQEQLLAELFDVMRRLDDSESN
ncbi:hypothetical protein L873DRAFT_1820969 [Choiromyces venosus 120613-1]|uniref:Transposase IS30-like HTH domain-containing protein n=1 Tax=Choiromyces venosus 120613-1 TaxID=1336337 RepID=A0A3N4J9K9_9PEZI|nr:hypothetical protein L873DRAFT_1820969 [Choiromyces venosus 120613-1]